jgi:hypothetical protein
VLGKSKAERCEFSSGVPFVSEGTAPVFVKPKAEPQRRSRVELTKRSDHKECTMSIKARVVKSTAILCAALTASLAVSAGVPAVAGESTGTWKYYPQGVYGGYGNPYYGGGSPYYSNRQYYGGYRQPGYGYGYNRGYYGAPYYEDRGSDAGAAVAAGVVGLAAGAILGGALSQRSHRASCAQYRSYNPRTGTYVGRNGVRYACR